MKDKKILLAGNPNVGKSTVFNEITGQHCHTGNWAGKTVELASGKYYYKFNNYDITDLPGTYSLIPSSGEEKIAAEQICTGDYDCVIVVIDSTMLERNLILFYQIFEITSKVAVLLNLCDEAKKRSITIDREALQNMLGVPVIKATARSGKGISELLEQVHIIANNAENHYTKKNFDAGKYDMKNIADKAKFVTERVQKKLPDKKERREEIADKILLGKYTSAAASLVIFALILWLTVTGANYPSELLSAAFTKFELLLEEKMTDFGFSQTAVSLISGGAVRVALWVIAVMLPPMAIFFPLFGILEESGVLPRFAFNLDRPFEKCHACGKQALTTCMGLGCNAVGVTGARIIGSKKERAIAIITNSLTPCNGRFSLLTAIITIFFAKNSFKSALILTAFLLLSGAMTLACSAFLGKYIIKGESGSLVLELPKYRTPDIKRLLADTVREKILTVLLRALVAAVPAGLIIWALANIKVGAVPLLNIISTALDPIGRAIGLDGAILFAFILGLPASEIVLPVMLMIYLSQGEIGAVPTAALGEILTANGWTVKTAVCSCIFCMFHFPCATTLLTIFKETKSAKQTVLSVITPLACGILLCAVVNIIFP